MKTKAIIILVLMIVPATLFCQSFKSPVEYMNYMSDEYKRINKDTWEYTSAVAHGKSAKKVEKKRKEVLKTVDNARKSIKKIKGYDGDNALRDSVISFLNINYDVINSDYAKIVDMEAIAEQSYDAMEAYLMAQEKANDKLGMACDMLKLQQDEYARDHNILIDTEKDDITKKLNAAEKVFSYYNEIYLIFFKSYKQEAYLMEAINKKDVNGIEQNKNALISTAKEGMEKLKSLKSFNGDPTIKTNCKEMLSFYHSEGENDIAVITDFYLKNDNFSKVKAAFDSKKESKRTQADVDEFNKAINDINAASDAFNAKNKELFDKRSKLLEKWNTSVNKFLDKHVEK